MEWLGGLKSQRTLHKILQKILQKAVQEVLLEIIAFVFSLCLSVLILKALAQQTSCLFVAASQDSHRQTVYTTSWTGLGINHGVSIMRIKVLHNGQDFVPQLSHMFLHFLIFSYICIQFLISSHSFLCFIISSYRFLFVLMFSYSILYVLTIYLMCSYIFL